MKIPHANNPEIERDFPSDAPSPMTTDKAPERAVMVKPLGWKLNKAAGFYYADVYRIKRHGPHWALSKTDAAYGRVGHFAAFEEAQAAAQADYEQRILSALAPAAPSPDVLADPRVRELVEAAQELEKQAKRAVNLGAVTGSHWTYLGMARMKMASALARITDTGGRKDG